MKSISSVVAGPLAMLAASAAFAQAPEYGAPRYQEPSYQERRYEERPVQAAAPQGAPLPQPELDQILAPVALYPDSLLSQLLMAATYPQDVAQAARWSRANPGLQGDEAVRAVENEPWPPAVKSLVAFPELLAAMGDQPQWTERLGRAFLASEGAVMQTVQELRRRADQAGNLRSSERIVVDREGENYSLESPSPETVYVPYYDPRVAYGSWWWPDYQPVYWNPWPGYAYYGGLGFGWGRGISLRRGFFYGGFDWHRRHVRYASHRPYYFHGNHYSRGWRNDGRRDGHYDGRNDGRRYSNDRRGDRPQYRDRPQYNNDTRVIRAERTDGNTRYANPAVRTIAPRFGMDGARPGGYRIRTERSDRVQRVAPIQREARVPRPVPQAVVPSAGIQRRDIARPPRAERGSDGHRGSNRGDGGGRGRER